jgi:hypothetical protein
MPVGDQLPCLFGRACKTFAVDKCLETALQRCLDLERKDLVDIGIRADKSGALQVLHELGFL